jgi:hypothetical protein
MNSSALIVRRRPLTVALLAMVIAAASMGCNLFGLSGQGPVTTETRQVGAFTGVDADAGIAVNIRIGPAATVEVQAQANILPIIATDLQGDTLRIRSTQGYNTSEGVTVNIVVPSLTGITLSGGSEGTAEGITAEALAISLSGGAVLTASGSSASLALNINGGSIGNLDSLLTQTITVDISGGANSTVNAAVSVTGSASGGSHLTVHGGATLNVTSSGGSNVSNT